MRAQPSTEVSKEESRISPHMLPRMSLKSSLVPVASINVSRTTSNLKSICAMCELDWTSTSSRRDYMWILIHLQCLEQQSLICTNSIDQA